MFQFLDELYDVSQSNKNEFNDDFKLTMLGSQILYVSNYIKILSYNSEILILKVKDNELNVAGVGLAIKQLSGKEVIIKGRINRIHLTKEYVVEK